MKSPVTRNLKVTICGLLLFTSVNGLPAMAGYVPGLGEIMAQTASRHIKLWYAGLAQNWQLAAYEIDELKEGFDDAGKFHPTHKHIKQKLPVLIKNYMHPPLEQLEQAIKDRNLDAFKKSYDSLTSACNACHQATEFGFNQVQQPNYNPFANQVFETKDRN